MTQKKEAISTLICYASISASLELLISSSTTISSQDLSKGWSRLPFRVPKALSEHKMHFVCLWLYYAIHQYTAGTSQAFNSIESFSWYKLLSFTVIFIHYLQDWLLLKLLTNTFLRGHNSFHFCYISCLAYTLLIVNQ